MSKNIVFEGWLTKSPPTKRIWRTKWRRRWFALRQSGDLPGQYFLDYYADRNCRRLKGTINLDLCEQVDAGLHMERAGNGSVDPNLRGSVFTIQTQSRTYHLEADCEEDMEKWVDAICHVCGLRSAEDAEEEIRPYQRASGSISPTITDGTGPYIPISECITGVRAQGRPPPAFVYEQKGLVLHAPLRRFPERHQYTSQPHIRLHHAEVSENESNLSEDESTASQTIRNWSVTKSFTRTPTNKFNGVSEGPPVPPRPPKSLPLARDNMAYIQKDSFQGIKFQETVEVHDPQVVPRMARRLPPSPGRLRALPASLPDQDEETSPGPASLHYCNLPSMPPSSPPSVPPAVDRNLKPRHSSIGQINHLVAQLPVPQSVPPTPLEIKAKADALQYLDLDLSSAPPVKKNSKVAVYHEKSRSAVDADAESAYRTVDFLKTEAFNITRADAEANRSNQH